MQIASILIDFYILFNISETINTAKAVNALAVIGYILLVSTDILVRSGQFTMLTLCSSPLSYCLLGVQSHSVLKESTGWNYLVSTGPILSF